ncbi:hypothetical protein LV457_00950 [Mycobacterium sp. MYCO198283]|uniref:hypothetical protein n=1 Tax=Mycobacterium sp. MYCO198283 TaxID=2883505 RepID=UPI001E5185E3|nr:hypothetical protein [Mycobacterium sp. MYCO198283]MCG5430868.1 hypothetical protein [Mycobacterium sp. MYCO198283]
MTAAHATPTATPTPTRDRFLRLALRADAVISGLTGVAALAVAPWLAEHSGTSTAFEYASGAFFVGYGAVVYALSTRARLAAPGTAVMVANVLYALGAVALVVVGPFALTDAGVALVLGSGVYTLVMADLQYVGLRRLKA